MSRRRKLDQKIIDLGKSIDPIKFRKAVQAGFADFPDPRQICRVIYPTWYILLVIISGFIARNDTTEEIVEFADYASDWFEKLIGKDYSPPKYNTIWEFLVRVHPEAFKAMLRKWLRELPEDLKRQIFAIDGKRVKRSSKNGKVLNCVELFSSEDGLVLAQEKVPGESGTDEKATLKDLLEPIDVTGGIISMDAHYTYRPSANLILSKGADYIMALKSNQETLFYEAKNCFEQAHADNFSGVPHTFHRSESIGHGRKEIREVRAIDELGWLELEWPGLQCLIEVSTTREEKGKSVLSRRYYISSRNAKAEDYAHWIRCHWHIENRLHWVLDVIFKEDESSGTMGYLGENLAILRRLSMNIGRSFDPGRGLASMRRAASFNPNYLAGILSMLFVK